MQERVTRGCFCLLLHFYFRGATLSKSCCRVFPEGGVLLLTLLMCASLCWAAENRADDESGCWAIAGQLPHTALGFGHGLLAVPRNAIRPRNLAWELPVAAASGLLMTLELKKVVRRLPGNCYERY